MATNFFPAFLSIELLPEILEEAFSIKMTCMFSFKFILQAGKAVLHKPQEGLEEAQSHYHYFNLLLLRLFCPTMMLREKL